MNPTKVTAYIKNKFDIKEGDVPPHVLKGLDREQLYKLFAELGYKVGCEVGVEKGKNAQTMFECIPNLKLFAVDSYKQHPQHSYEATSYLSHWDQHYLDGVKAQAQKRMQNRNAVIIEKFSEDAAKDVPDNSLDFVYIDADHSYNFIKQDIILWRRKVRKGGIVSGHDYILPGEYLHTFDINVKEAVDDYTKLHKISPLYLTDKTAGINRNDKYTSWFFVKI